MQAKFIHPYSTKLSDALGLLLLVVFEPTVVFYIHMHTLVSHYRSCHVCLLQHAPVLSILNLF